MDTPVNFWMRDVSGAKSFKFNYELQVGRSFGTRFYERFMQSYS